MGEVRERLETGDDAPDIGRRPVAHRCQHRRGACLGDHRLRVALAQRQHAQRKVAGDFDGGAAHADSERQAEIGIARDAGEKLDAVGHELLHQERALRRRRIEPVETLAHLRAGARKLLVVP